jgi:tetratricopeptide (TPR) repeat protein
MRSRIALVAVAMLCVGGCRIHQTLPRDPVAPHPMLARAEQAYLKGEHAEALRLFRGYADGFGAGDGVATARYWEGVILLERGMAAEARQPLELAHGAVRSRRVRAQVLMALGDVGFALDDYPGAIRRYQEALDLQVPDARNDYAVYRLGVARQRAGDWGGGKSSYDVLVRDYPASALIPLARRRLDFPASGFHIEVQRFTGEDRAAALERELERRGYPARRVHDASADRPWRVWAGPFASYHDASIARGALSANLDRRLEILP